MRRMKEAIEYRDILLEILALEEKVFGTSDEPKHKPEVQQMKAEAEPEPEKPKKKPIDRQKVINMHKRGMINSAIAEELGCSYKTVWSIVNEYTSQEGTKYDPH